MHYWSSKSIHGANKIKWMNRKNTKRPIRAVLIWLLTCLGKTDILQWVHSIRTKKKKEALLEADISSLVRSHVLLQWADRTPPSPAPSALRQASRGQPSMEEIFLFRWGLHEGAQNGITEEEYNVVWRALRATPIRPHFRRRQSNLAVMCKDTYLPGEDFRHRISEGNGNRRWQQRVSGIYSQHLISMEKVPWEDGNNEEIFGFERSILRWARSLNSAGEICGGCWEFFVPLTIRAPVLRFPSALSELRQQRLLIPLSRPARRRVASQRSGDTRLN